MIVAARSVLTGFAVLLLAQAGPVSAAQDPEEDWRELLERALHASQSGAYEARVAVVTLGADGPGVAEVDVAQVPGRALQVARGEAWMVGRQGTDAFFWRAGTVLRLGSVDETGIDPRAIAAKYDVALDGPAELDTGPATVLVLSERDARYPRERIYVDRRTHLLVRRETFADGGVPSRLVAFTELRTSPPVVTMPYTEVEHHRGEYRTVTHAGLDILDDLGWVVLTELPDSYALRGAYALPEAQGTSLHLVYSDGLYTLSVYQQHGNLDPAELEDAVRHQGPQGPVYRWPGATPDRRVWSGAGLTFTAITDAPEDHLDRATSILPHDPAATLPQRLTRGLGRVVQWLWPF